MKELEEEALVAFLKASGIHAADPSSNIGREISFKASLQRTVVVHVGEPFPEDYFLGVLSLVLRTEDTWLLVPRFGFTKGISITHTPASGRATLIEASERDQAIALARDHLNELMTTGDDFYFISSNGKAIASIDHHMFTEGMTISYKTVPEAGALLAALNNAAAEVQLYSKTS